MEATLDRWYYPASALCLGDTQSCLISTIMYHCMDGIQDTTSNKCLHLCKYLDNHSDITMRHEEYHHLVPSMRGFFCALGWYCLYTLQMNIFSLILEQIPSFLETWSPTRLVRTSWCKCSNPPNLLRISFRNVYFRGHHRRYLYQNNKLSFFPHQRALSLNHNSPQLYRGLGTIHVAPPITPPCLH